MNVLRSSLRSKNFSSLEILIWNPGTFINPK